MCESWLKKPKVKGRCICNEHWKKNKMYSLHRQCFITQNSVIFKSVCLFFSIIYLQDWSYLLCLRAPKYTRHSLLAPKNLINVNTKAQLWCLPSSCLVLNWVYLSFCSFLSTFSSASGYAKSSRSALAWTWCVHGHNVKTDDNSEFDLQAKKKQKRLNSSNIHTNLSKDIHDIYVCIYEIYLWNDTFPTSTPFFSEE